MSVLALKVKTDPCDFCSKGLLPGNCFPVIEDCNFEPGKYGHIVFFATQFSNSILRQFLRCGFVRVDSSEEVNVDGDLETTVTFHDYREEATKKFKFCRERGDILFSYEESNSGNFYHFDRATGVYEVRYNEWYVKGKGKSMSVYRCGVLWESDFDYTDILHRLFNGNSRDKLPSCDEVVLRIVDNEGLGMVVNKMAREVVDCFEVSDEFSVDHSVLIDRSMDIDYSFVTILDLHGNEILKLCFDNMKGGCLSYARNSLNGIEVSYSYYKKQYKLK